MAHVIAKKLKLKIYILKCMPNKCYSWALEKPQIDFKAHIKGVPNSESEDNVCLVVFLSRRVNSKCWLTVDPPAITSHWRMHLHITPKISSNHNPSKISPPAACNWVEWHSLGSECLWWAIESEWLSGSLFISHSQRPGCLCGTIEGRELSGSPLYPARIEN